jgi:hypothetical protein
LTPKEFVVAQYPRMLLKVLWLIVGYEHPSGLLSGQQSGNGESLNVSLVPVKGTHGEQIAGTVPKGLDGRFHVRQLLEKEVSVLAVGADRSFNLEANTVVAGRGGENHETPTGFHRFTSVKVDPHMSRAWTTG